MKFVPETKLTEEYNRGWRDGQTSVRDQYSKGECVQCHKEIVGHYGGYYRNYKGQVFCSHECIDNYKLT